MLTATAAIIIDSAGKHYLVMHEVWYVMIASN